MFTLQMSLQLDILKQSYLMVMVIDNKDQSITFISENEVKSKPSDYAA